MLPFQIKFTTDFPARFPKFTFLIPVYHPMVGEDNTIAIEKAFDIAKFKCSTNNEFSKTMAGIRTLVSLFYSKKYFYYETQSIRPELVQEIIQNEAQFKEKVRKCIKHSHEYLSQADNPLFIEYASHNTNAEKVNININVHEQISFPMSNTAYKELNAMLNNYSPDHPEQAVQSITNWVLNNVNN